MSLKRFLDLMMRLESFKRVFVFCPKMDFLLRGKSTVLG